MKLLDTCMYAWFDDTTCTLREYSQLNNNIITLLCPFLKCKIKAATAQMYRVPSMFSQY